MRITVLAGGVGGARFLRGLRALLEREHEPQGEVDHDDDAEEERQYDGQDPDQAGIHAQGTGEAAADAARHAALTQQVGQKGHHDHAAANAQQTG